MEKDLIGGFTSFRKFNSEEEAMFNHVMEHFQGVNHSPLAVATQKVNGTNFAFLCESKIVIPDSESYNTLVIIHKPLPNVSEAPILMEIRNVKII